MSTTATRQPPRPETTPTRSRPNRLRAWLLADTEQASDQLGAHARPERTEKTHRWWQVMCLTGVDYFSTLGYQPGIAALAAGVISPIATIVLVALTLFGALPVYRRVAAESPRGEGSIAMLERLLSFWKGKLFVLALLGFAATDFMITMTLSAADATAHLIENPHLKPFLGGQQLVITLLLLALLGAVFLRGFGEAIGIAVVLVGVYLALNVVVIGDGLLLMFREPLQVDDWWTALTTQHGSPIMVVAIALVVFPKLALGLSGFETGVAVMPHIDGAPDDDPAKPAGRIRGARRLLTIGSDHDERLPDHQQHRHHGADPGTRVPARRSRQRSGARLSGAPESGQRVRHRLRRVDDRHLVVRRCVGDGRSAQSDPALPAALRDGAAVDAGVARWCWSCCSARSSSR